MAYFLLSVLVLTSSFCSLVPQSPSQAGHFAWSQATRPWRAYLAQLLAYCSTLAGLNASLARSPASTSVPCSPSLSRLPR
ncbi:hypothetical protein CF326_g6484 [Tilletia indica]|nr:hypothetical protein CF326_g6484 [Tilletia indica]